jgi:CRP/FNR family transcriptional regulator
MDRIDNFPDTANSICEGSCKWLFDELSPTALDEIKHLCRHIHYGDNELLFHEGEPSFGFYLICEGRVKLSKRTSSGKKMILQILGPGDLLGAETVFGGNYFDSFAETMMETTVHFIDRSALAEMMRSNPHIGAHLIERLSMGVRMLQSKLVETAYEGSHERMANLLLSLAERYGRNTLGGVDLGMDLTRGELAEMAGLTTETAIRVLSKFQRRGWLTLKRNQVVVHDLPALENLAERYFEPVAAPEYEDSSMVTPV